MIEIGSYEGQSACYLITKYAAIRPIEIHCVDTWEGGREHDASQMADVERRFDYNIDLAIHRSVHPVAFTKHKSTSAAALRELLGQRLEPFDLIYIDGSHYAPDVLVDAVIGFQLLRVGGMMIFDDYLWHLETGKPRDLLNMPKLAIDAFTNIFAQKIKVHSMVPLNQIFATKTSE